MILKLYNNQIEVSQLHCVLRSVSFNQRKFHLHLLQSENTRVNQTNSRKAFQLKDISGDLLIILCIPSKTTCATFSIKFEVLS